MPVAKSYQKLQICGEPYEKNKKKYIVVQCDNGYRKEVRWYTDAEYAKMYPDTAPAAKVIKPLKEVLGFTKGYITIFKGDTYPLLEWFQQEPKCRYHGRFGWYIVSEEELPEIIPAGLTPVQLKWEDVADVENDALKSDALVRQAVEALLYEPSKSKHLGNVGDRLDLTLKVIKTTTLDSDFYGSSTFHLMEDADGNEFCWTTASKTLELGQWYTMRGTVKQHQVYKGKNQTVLTRCTLAK